jgi:arylsulfatase A-like enzyme/Flp pilus assembly protein TadD
MRLRRSKSFHILFFSALAVVFSLISAKAEGAELNLLLVTIDTLRTDRLSCYSSKYVKTPTIDALASKGILFEKAFAHNPITLPSHANILLGTTPLYHGVSENSKTKVADAFLTLAEHLKSNGYATGAFVGAFPLDSRFGLDQGFDVYDDSFPTKSVYTYSYSERKAEQVISSALAWISKQRGKWFCWVHLWDPHAPYLPPEPYLREYKSDPYSGEVAYVDAELGKLFENLQKKRWMEKTLVILTADHGESLGEHGELTHSFFAYNSTIWIPLIVAGPGIQDSRVGEYVCHIDIFPTVCEILNVVSPPFLQGKSLMPLIKGKKGKEKPIYFESLEPYLNKGCAPLRGFIENQKKYTDSQIPEVYDLAKDFDETENLATKTDLVSFKKKLQEMDKNLSSPWKRAGNQAVDRQTLERLRSLGYVASPVAQLKATFGPEDDLKSFLPYQQKLELAIARGDVGEKDESIGLMNSLINERKDFIPAYTVLSQIYMVQGRMQEALRVMEGGYRDNPENYTLLSAYGALLVKAAMYDQAVEVLQKGLSILDFDPEDWDNLGIAYWRKGEFQKALDCYQKAVALDKSFALAYSNLGALYISFYYENRWLENLTNSIENFRKAVALDPTLNLAFRGLGVVSKMAGKDDDAISAWEKAVETDPNDHFSIYNLGIEYLEKGAKAQALKCFQKYLELERDRLSPEERDKVLALIEKCK